MRAASIDHELRRLFRREPFVIQAEERARRASIVPTTPEHVAYLLPRVRIFDEEAVREHYGRDGRDMLAEAVRTSMFMWTGLVDGQPICAFGLYADSILSARGMPWLIPTPDVARHRRIFWRCSREVVDMMLERFPCLIAHCQANYDASRKWLERLGFVEVPEGSFHLAFRERDPKAFRPGIGFVTLQLTRN